jgi:uncharacterized protein (TIGR02246 family)
MDPETVARDVARDFADAWNRHDMGDLARLFDEDASLVNVVGMLMRGRDEIEHQHALAHAGPYRSSTLVTTLIETRVLAADVVVCHIRCEVSGDERRPGETRPTLLTFVMTPAAGDAWNIATGQNTPVTVPV